MLASRSYETNLAIASPDPFLPCNTLHVSPLMTSDTATSRPPQVQTATLEVVGESGRQPSDEALWTLWSLFSNDDVWIDKNVPQAYIDDGMVADDLTLLSNQELSNILEKLKPFPRRRLAAVLFPQK